jgi:DHA1 family bicyclomycin/chloramphenicol resistance-like MFS transporter
MQLVVDTPRAQLAGRPLLIFLTLLMALSTLSTNMYLASFPSLGSDLGATPAQVKLTLSVFLIGVAAGQLVIGPLSDRYGRRPLLLAGLALYAIASALCALAANIEWMLGIRVAQAIGACTGAVLSRAVARDLFQGDALTKTLAFMTTMMAVAPGFSPLLGGLVETWAGWRATFWLLAAIGLFATLVVWLRLPETHTERGNAPTVGRAFASYGPLMVNRAFMIPALAIFCSMAGLFAFFVSSPSIFIERFGIPPVLFGLIPCFTVFAVFAGGFAAPKLAKRWSGMRPVAFGFLLMALGSGTMLVLALFGSQSVVAGMAQVLAPLLVFLFGMGIVNPLATVAALRPFPEKAGAASALIGFFQIAGGAGGSLLIGLVPLPTLIALPAVMITACMAALAALALGGRRL